LGRKSAGGRSSRGVASEVGESVDGERKETEREEHQSSGLKRNWEARFCVIRNASDYRLAA